MLHLDRLHRRSASEIAAMHAFPLRLLALALVALLGAVGVPPGGRGQEEKKAQPAAGRKLALVVGVRQYKKGELRPLKYADKDAAALAGALQGGGYRRVVLMTYASAAEDADLLPTARNIMAQLRALTEGCAKEDSIVVAFTGHGAQLGGPKDFYLCPIDAELADKDTLVALADVYKELAGSKAGTKMVLLDACYAKPSASATVRVAPQPRPQDLAVPLGVRALFACSPGQFCYESDRAKQGLFFHYLLKGAAGAAATKSGAITLASLARYVRDELPDAVKEHAGPRARQVPLLKGGAETAVAFLPGPASFEAPLPGVKGVVNTVGMRLVLLPKGRFRMGSPDGELGRDGDEGPVHEVELTRPFYLSAHTVTVGQFKQFVKATGYRTEAETDGRGGNGFDPVTRKVGNNQPRFNWKEVGWPQTDRHPVVNVSWNDATKFCEWLSKKERKTYRLPTEAEWEYACRASTATRYWSGDADESLKGSANIADQSLQARMGPGVGAQCVPWDDGHPFTAPVGRFRPNPWGLYDMHGNVFQWCHDWLDTNYYRTSPPADPPGPANGTRRVYRGGSWNSNPRGARSAYRLWGAPSERSCRLGFRVACEAR
jgi:formylglycine-generating enzyme required for sulfatase activity